MTARSVIMSAAMLSGCSGAKEDDMAGRPIECRIGQARDFARVCSLERDGDIRVVHHPDGGFRRLRIAGGKITAADGAESPTESRDEQGRPLVSIGGNSYRLPNEGGE
jgi:hypothetical protein